MLFDSTVSSAFITSPAAVLRTALPVWLLWLLWVSVVGSAVLLIHASQPVRFASVDDVASDHLVRTGRLESHSITSAPIQGRFYLAAPCHLWPYRIYEVDSPLHFSTIRAALLLAQMGLTAWLCGRVAQNPAVGWLTMLLETATLHLPATFFAALSYPTMAIGFCSLLASLHLHLLFLRRGSPIAALSCAVLFLHACLYLEVFVVYLPLYFFLSWQNGRKSASSMLRSVAGLLAATLAYLSAYAFFVSLYPSTYGGTRFSANVGEFLDALVRLTFGVTPGLELIVHRTHPAGGGPLLKTGMEIAGLFTATPFWHYALAALQCVTFGSLLLRTRLAGRTALWFVAVAIACAFLPNLPVAVTERYQIWIHHREYPYIYSFYSYCALAAGAAFALPGVVFHPRLSVKGRKICATIIGLGVCVLFVSAKASNSHTLALLQQWHNPDASFSARHTTIR